jgi:hypothetical protein
MENVLLRRKQHRVGEIHPGVLEQMHHIVRLVEKNVQKHQQISFV